MSRFPMSARIASLFLFQAFFIFVPMTILGRAIDWPASLDLPADEILPLILQREASVRLGYGLYFAWSLAFAATSIVLVRLVSPPGPLGSLAIVAAGAGVSSAVARCIGISRWLSGSMTLAHEHAASQSGTARRESIEIAQSVVNSYGGLIGEMVGVGVCTSMWLACVGILILTSRRLPVLLGWVALAVSALSAVPLVSAMGLTGEISPSVTVSSVNLWLAAVGFWLIFRGSSVVSGPAFENVGGGKAV